MYREKACELFCNGYNCAQATVGAFAEKIGLSLEDATTYAAGFGGGGAGTREVCGAISGLLFVAGKLHGAYDPLDNKAKTAFYKRVQGLIQEFTDEFGTTNCAELLKKAAILPKKEPSERTAAYYATRPCVRFVEKAAQLLEKEFI